MLQNINIINRHEEFKKLGSSDTKTPRVLGQKLTENALDFQGKQSGTLDILLKL